MPVKMLNFEELPSDVIDDVIIENICSAEPVLSDDIWNKFELDFSLGDDLFNFDILDCNINTESLKELCEIRNHDCMWAGHCGSKEHPARESIITTTTTVYKDNKKSTTIQPGRSLLLKQPVTKLTTIQAAATVASPDSPPMSDDEECKPNITLQILKEMISECQLDDDSDLCEYFEDGDDIIKDPQEDEQKQPQRQITTTTTTSHLHESDHSYHKDKNASMRMSNLGIETPSDSGRIFFF